MTETSSRLLEMLSLLQGRRDWPGGELADRLGVSGRTIRRDVERLRRLGYPVESLTGPAGGYRLRAGSAMPPLLLDDDEAIAIAVGGTGGPSASTACTDRHRPGCGSRGASSRRRTPPRTWNAASPRRRPDTTRASSSTHPPRRSPSASPSTGASWSRWTQRPASS